MLGDCSGRGPGGGGGRARPRAGRDRRGRSWSRAPGAPRPSSTTLRARVSAHGWPTTRRPTAWYLVDELPLTPMAKVDKRALAARRAPSSETRRVEGASRAHDRDRGLSDQETTPQAERGQGAAPPRQHPIVAGAEPIKLGSMLFTLVEPRRGHEVAYNRWYERDHFYAGCMIGPYQFAGKRFVATAELKALRDPDPSERHRRARPGQLPVGVLGARRLPRHLEPLGRRPGEGPAQGGPHVQRARPRPHPSVPLRLGARPRAPTASPPSSPSTTPRPGWWPCSPTGPRTSTPPTSSRGCATSTFPRLLPGTRGPAGHRRPTRCRCSSTRPGDVPRIGVRRPSPADAVVPRQRARRGLGHGHQRPPPGARVLGQGPGGGRPAVHPHHPRHRHLHRHALGRPVPARRPEEAVVSTEPAVVTPAGAPLRRQDGHRHRRRLGHRPGHRHPPGRRRGPRWPVSTWSPTTSTRPSRRSPSSGARPWPTAATSPTRRR